MDWIVGGLFGLGALATVATLLPIWKTTRWWVRVCDFPRFQIAIIALAVFGMFVVVRLPTHLTDWLLLCALGLVIVWQFTWVGPYIPSTARAVKSCQGTESESERIALFTTNVLLTNRNSDRLLEIIHEAGPDVVLAVEVDEWWTDRLCTGLSTRYPNRICYPLSNGYGLALFSRLELIEPKIRFLLDDAIPSIRTEVRLRSGARVSLYGVHPRPPAVLQDSTERDVELLRVAMEIKDRGSPAIVLGDLNDVAWSPTTLQFMKAGDLLDPRRGRGFYNTYPARWPGLRYPLDYVFCTRHFEIRTMRVLPSFDSDHLPLVAELVLSGKNSRERFRAANAKAL
jgi:endonuclease/exonuclease/phosphatase (EEP) superfamily protein YafD